MATGSLSGGQCFDTNIEAIDGYFSSLSPFQYYDSNLKKSISITYQPVSGVAGTWQKSTQTGNAIVLTPAVPPPFPLCNAPSEFFAQGLQIGSAIVAVLVLGWGIGACASVLKR
jgi:hypothetical protein